MAEEISFTIADAGEGEQGLFRRGKATGGPTGLTGYAPGGPGSSSAPTNAPPSGVAPGGPRAAVPRGVTPGGPGAVTTSTATPPSGVTPGGPGAATATVATPPSGVQAGGPGAPQSTTGVLPGGPSAATSTGPPTSSTLPTQPATGPSGLVLPLGWEEKFDAQRGVPYFVDHNTRSTHWELPADIMAQAQALTNPASTASLSGPPSFGAQLMLPQGWEMKMDESRGIPYYVDHNTRSTHWELPAEIAAWSKAQQAPAPAVSQPAAPLALLPGWEEKFDAQRGVPYFVDHNTRATHWELPANVLAQMQANAAAASAVSASPYGGGGMSAAPQVDVTGIKNSIEVHKRSMEQAANAGDEVGLRAARNEITSALTQVAAYDPQYAAAVQAFIQDQNGRLDQVVYQSRYQQAKAEMEQAKSVVDQAISFNDEVGAEGAKRNLLAAKDRHNAVISMSYEGQQYLREIDQFLVGAQTRIENIKKINRIKGSIANDMELMRQGIDAGDDTRAGTHRRNVVESLEDLRRLSQDPAMGTFIEGQYVALDELDRRLQKIVLENKIRALKADITAQKDTLSRAVNCGNEEDANFVRMQIQSAVETLSNLLASDDDVADDVTFISEIWSFVEGEMQRLRQIIVAATFERVRGNVANLQATVDTWVSADQLDYAENGKQDVLREIDSHRAELEASADGPGFISSVNAWASGIDASIAAKRNPQPVSMPTVNPYGAGMPAANPYGAGGGAMPTSNPYGGAAAAMPGMVATPLQPPPFTPTPPAEPQLPAGWERKYDGETGRPYYIDHNTRSTHWELPAGYGGAAPVSAPAPAVTSQPGGGGGYGTGASVMAPTSTPYVPPSGVLVGGPGAAVAPTGVQPGGPGGATSTVNTGTLRGVTPGGPRGIFPGGPQ